MFLFMTVFTWTFCFFKGSLDLNILHFKEYFSTSHLEVAEYNGKNMEKTTRVGSFFAASSHFIASVSARTPRERGEAWQEINGIFAI